MGARAEVRHWHNSHFHDEHWHNAHWIGTDVFGGALIEAMEGWARFAEAMQGSTGIEELQGE